ncbi:HAF repeat-containing protein [Amycolatopsis thailandensis]|uniref:HAF repeat-containing protein n=1 Tax=Amycolatopsis thailandensis TaxID=589330 RepID=UPI0036416679
MSRNRVQGRRRPVLSLTAALVVSAGALTGTARADTAGPVMLERLPGDDSSLVLAVNDAGAMVGLSSKGRDPRISHPVRWDADGRITALPTQGDGQGSVRDINRHGVSTGIAATPTGSAPARWDAEGRVTTMQLPPGYYGASPWAISDNGVVVGTWITSGYWMGSFRWDPDNKVTDLGTLPGGDWTWAKDISDDGRIITGVAAGGDKVNHAVRWMDGLPMTRLAPDYPASSTDQTNGHGVSAGSIFENPGAHDAPVTWDRDGTMHRLEVKESQLLWINAISSTGYVIGSNNRYPPDDRWLFLWTPDGALTILPDDQLSAVVKGVDAEGTVVGSIRGEATVWFRNGERRRLVGLPGGKDTTADLINDRGRVVGSVTDSQWKTREVFWDLK